MLAKLIFKVPPALTSRLPAEKVGLILRLSVPALATCRPPRLGAAVWMVTGVAVEPSPICNVPANVHADDMVSAVLMIQVSVLFVKTVAGVPAPPGDVYQFPATV